MARYLDPAEFPCTVVETASLTYKDRRSMLEFETSRLAAIESGDTKGAVFALVADQHGAPDQWMRWVTAAPYVPNVTAYAKNRVADQRRADAVPAGDRNGHAFVNLCSSSR
jgi:hypothetical protein